VFFFIGKASGQVISKGQQTIEIKKGSSVILRANSEGASSYLWFKDGLLINGQNKSSIITSSPGVYKVASINIGGCTSDLSDDIILKLKIPQADLAIIKRSDNKVIKVNENFKYYINIRNNGADDATLIIVKDVLPENLSFVSVALPKVGIAKYDEISKTIFWDLEQLANGHFAELVITVKSLQPGKISNTAVVSGDEIDPNLSNNKSTDIRDIAGIRIPNVFTPNGDGKNETFIIENLQQFEHNEVTIINRWGSTVYESKNYLNDWTAEGLGDGTYYYVVKVKNGTSSWLEYKGYITVMR
jgi:gliding motility-associated-like protein/uncharacterized repeat protein (TIGR01451 family)